MNFMFSRPIYTTAFSLWKRIKCFPSTLHLRSSKAEHWINTQSLWLCVCRNPAQAGNYLINVGSSFSKRSAFKNVFYPTWLKPFEKLCWLTAILEALNNWQISVGHNSNVPQADKNEIKQANRFCFDVKLKHSCSSEADCCGTVQQSVTWKMIFSTCKIISLLRRQCSRLNTSCIPYYSVYNTLYNNG